MHPFGGAIILTTPTDMDLDMAVLAALSFLPMIISIMGLGVILVFGAMILFSVHLAIIQVILMAIMDMGGIDGIVGTDGTDGIPIDIFIMSIQSLEIIALSMLLLLRGLNREEERKTMKATDVLKGLKSKILSPKQKIPIQLL